MSIERHGCHRQPIHQLPWFQPQLILEPARILSDDHAQTTTARVGKAALGIGAERCSRRVFI
jgi:hypothetical protein